ncbi:MAG: hypothetical protein IKC93_00545, partial [Candidatus Methanomethylophilaceae archaeon]|nr:hypothetical protein [Candidatus Methanomethylophilaceae archaeon]
MAMVMVFAGAAFIAAEVDAGDTSAETQTYTYSQGVVVGADGSISVGVLSDLQTALIDPKVTVINITADIVIPDNQAAIDDPADDKDTYASCIVITKAVTINGNDNEITWKAKDDGTRSGSVIRIQVPNATDKVVINNLMITNTGSAYTAAVVVASDVDLTMNEVTVESLNYGIMTFGGDVKITDSKVNAWGSVYIKEGTDSVKITGSKLDTFNIAGNAFNNFGALILETTTSCNVELDDVDITAINNNINNSTAKANGIIYSTGSGATVTGNVLLKNVTIDTSQFIGSQSAISLRVSDFDESKTWNVKTTIEGVLTVNGDINLILETGTITVDDTNYELTVGEYDSSVILKDGASIETGAGDIIDAKIGYYAKSTDSTPKTAELNITAGSSGLTISKGSLKISGTG